MSIPVAPFVRCALGWSIGSFWLLCISYAQRPSIDLQGRVLDQENKPVVGAHVWVREADLSAYTDEKGLFTLTLPRQSAYTLYVAHIAYTPLQQTLELERLTQALTLRVERRYYALDSISVRPKYEETRLGRMGISEVELADIELLPAIDTDLSRILQTLPGVATHSSLSNLYSVRGGNYQENLIFLENMPLYAPYLVGGAQQQGLGFGNLALAQSMSFSAGAWAAPYGDRLASMLQVAYKDPTTTKGSLQMSLLGAESHLEWANQAHTIRLLTGVRYKDTRSILRNLDIRGEYLPHFFDAQSMLRLTLGPQTTYPVEATLWGGYARNDYRVQPSTQRTSFGNIDRPLILYTYFDGRERLRHDIFQGAFKIEKQLSPIWHGRTWATAALSFEEQQVDLLSEFRLCDALPGPASSPERCEIEVGIGNNYDYVRNFLRGQHHTAQLEVEARWNEKNTFQAGFFLYAQHLNERLTEYSLYDSAGYQKGTHAASFDTRQTQYRPGAFLNYRWGNAQDTYRLQFGVRSYYASLSQFIALEPRLRNAWKPFSKRSLYLTLAVGLHHQPPFYREIRDKEANFYLNRAPQAALHIVTGAEYQFTQFARPFTLISEIYYKHLYRLIPYEEENTRLYYYPQYNATGFAYGLDVRLYGFFIPNNESWISFSLLQTKENIAEDATGYIRRPTDQNLSLSVFIRDHLPRLPDWRAHLQLSFGSNRPTNPTREFELRNRLHTAPYYRVDLGLSKVFRFRDSHNKPKRPIGRHLSDMTIALEGLNLFATRQPLSFTWITAYENTQIAAPNGFAGRYINLKIHFNFL